MDQTNGPAVNRQGLQMNCKKPGKDIKTKDILNTFQDFKNFNVIFDINEGKYPTFTFSNTTNEIFLIKIVVNFTHGRCYLVLFLSIVDFEMCFKKVPKS